MHLLWNNDPQRAIGDIEINDPELRALIKDGTPIALYGCMVDGKIRNYYLTPIPAVPKQKSLVEFNGILDDLEREWHHQAGVTMAKQVIRSIREKINGRS